MDNVIRVATESRLCAVRAARRWPDRTITGGVSSISKINIGKCLLAAVLLMAGAVCAHRGPMHSGDVTSVRPVINALHAWRHRTASLAHFQFSNPYPYPVVLLWTEPVCICKTSSIHGQEGCSVYSQSLRFPGIEFYVLPLIWTSEILPGQYFGFVCGYYNAEIEIDTSFAITGKLSTGKRNRLLEMNGSRNYGELFKWIEANTTVVTAHVSFRPQP